MLFFFFFNQLFDKRETISWFSLRLTDLLGPLYDLEVGERLVLLTKEPLHQVLD